MVPRRKNGPFHYIRRTFINEQQKNAWLLKTLRDSDAGLSWTEESISDALRDQQQRSLDSHEWYIDSGYDLELMVWFSYQSSAIFLTDEQRTKIKQLTIGQQQTSSVSTNNTSTTTSTTTTELQSTTYCRLKFEMHRYDPPIEQCISSIPSTGGSPLVFGKYVEQIFVYLDKSSPSLVSQQPMFVELKLGILTFNNGNINELDGLKLVRNQQFPTTITSTTTTTTTTTSNVTLFDRAPPLNPTDDPYQPTTTTTTTTEQEQIQQSILFASIITYQKPPEEQIREQQHYSIAMLQKNTNISTMEQNQSPLVKPQQEPMMIKDSGFHLNFRWLQQQQHNHHHHHQRSTTNEMASNTTMANEQVGFVVEDFQKLFHGQETISTVVPSITKAMFERWTVRERFVERQTSPCVNIMNIVMKKILPQHGGGAHIYFSLEFARQLSYGVDKRSIIQTIFETETIPEHGLDYIIAQPYRSLKNNRVHYHHFDIIHLKQQKGIKEQQITKSLYQGNRRRLKPVVVNVIEYDRDSFEDGYKKFLTNYHILESEITKRVSQTFKPRNPHNDNIQNPFFVPQQQPQAPSSMEEEEEEDRYRYPDAFFPKDHQ